MDNAEPYDLVTVLLRLEGFEGMGRTIGLGHSIDDSHVAATDGGRTGLFRKMLTSLRSWRSWPDGSAPRKS